MKSTAQLDAPSRPPRQKSDLPPDKLSGGHLWYVLALGIVTLLAMGRVCGNEFVAWDDPYTMNSPELKQQGIGYFWLHPHMDIYIPVTYTVWGVLRPLAAESEPDPWGMQLNPWIYHGASVLLHLLAALVVYAILFDLLGGRSSACLGAMLFAVHPIQMEAVAWASGMKDVLAGLLALIAIWQYLRFARSRRELKPQPNDAPSEWTHYAIASVAFLAAMLSKPNAALAAPIALVMDWWLIQRPLKKSIANLWPWFLAAAVIVAIAHAVQPGTGTLPVALSKRPLIVGASLAFYLGKLIWPHHLAADYGWRPVWLVTQQWLYWIWIIPTAIATLLWLLRKRFSELWVAALIFVIAPLPTLGLVSYEFMGFSTVADHYLYLAMLGPALALGWIVQWIIQRAGAQSGGLKPALHRRRAFGAVTAVVVVLLALLAARSFLQTARWKDSRIFWQHVLAVNPVSFAAEAHLGFLDQRDYRLDAALEHFDRAIKDNPDNLAAPVAAAEMLNLSPRLDKEDSEGKAVLVAIDGVPADVRLDATKCLFDLAGDMLQAGRFDRAIVYAQAAAKLADSNPDIQESIREKQVAAFMEQNALQHHKPPPIDMTRLHPQSPRPGE